MYNLSLHKPVVKMAVASGKVTMVQICAKILQLHIILTGSYLALAKSVKVA